MKDHDDRSVVAADGSPVEIYRALPFSPEFDPLLGASRLGSSVLDLGCGTGRLANRLVEEGYPVVGVDESEEMLRHVDRRVERIRERIEGLDLGRRVDEHVGTAGRVEVRFEVLSRGGSTFEARSTFRLGGQEWVQRFRARVVDDPEMASSLASAGLRLQSWLTPTWAIARHPNGNTRSNRSTSGWNVLGHLCV